MAGIRLSGSKMRASKVFRLLLHVFVFHYVLFSTVHASRAELPSVQEPCLGYNPETNAWSTNIVDPEHRDEQCASGYAFIAGSFHGWRATEPGSILIFGNCCRLPEGALLNEHVYELSKCPSGYVVTGMKYTTLGYAPHQYSMRCTRINEQQYTLGEAQPGITVGWQSEFFRNLFYSLFEKYEGRIARSGLPVGIRYAVGRRTSEYWEANACVGETPGSLLTEKLQKRCGGLRFKSLLHKQSVQPVALFPQCEALSSITDIHAHCIAIQGIMPPDTGIAPALLDQPLAPNVNEVPEQTVH